MYTHQSMFSPAPMGVQTVASGGARADEVAGVVGANGAISTLHEVNFIDASGASANTFTLDSGRGLGQAKVIVLRSKGGAGNVTVSGAFVGGTTLTLSAANQFASLRWNGSAWHMLAGTGAVA